MNLKGNQCIRHLLNVLLCSILLQILCYMLIRFASAIAAPHLLDYDSRFLSRILINKHLFRCTCIRTIFWLVLSLRPVNQKRPITSLKRVIWDSVMSHAIPLVSTIHFRTQLYLFGLPLCCFIANGFQFVSAKVFAIIIRADGAHVIRCYSVTGLLLWWLGLSLSLRFIC